MSQTLGTTMDGELLRALRLDAAALGPAPGIGAMLDSLRRQLASRLAADRRPEESDSGVEPSGQAAPAAASTAPSDEDTPMAPEPPAIESSRALGDPLAEACAAARRALPSPPAADLTRAVPLAANGWPTGPSQPGQPPARAQIDVDESFGAAGADATSGSFADSPQRASARGGAATIIHDNRQTIHINQNYPIWQRDRQHTRLLRGDTEQ